MADVRVWFPISAAESVPLLKAEAHARMVAGTLPPSGGRVGRAAEIAAKALGVGSTPGSGSLFGDLAPDRTYRE
jgi:hypothetical protein